MATGQRHEVRRRSGAATPLSTTRSSVPTVSHATELLRWGFYSIGVSLHEPVTDSLGHDHTVEIDAAWLGGVDTTDNSYLRDVVAEQINELADAPQSADSSPNVSTAKPS